MRDEVLIRAEALVERLGEPGLRIVDASWRLDGHDTRADFDRAHIPGAVFFDIDRFSDPDTTLPHMLPTPEAFAREAGDLGISDGDRVVIYGGDGSLSAARAWWMFRIMGARDVRVLDGGLAAWRAAGGPLTDATPAPGPAVFTATFDRHRVASAADVAAALADSSAQVVDARSDARFRGDAPEPRPGLRAGHMPGALNLPFGALFQPDGLMKPTADLRQAFTDAGIDPVRPVITSCGSGVTAAFINLALAVLGRDARLYDGSWSEWGARDDLPVVTG